MQQTPRHAHRSYEYCLSRHLDACTLSWHPDSMDKMMRLMAKARELEELRETHRMVVTELRTQADHVSIALTLGATWREVGAALGCSGQAAWERYSGDKRLGPGSATPRAD